MKVHILVFAVLVGVLVRQSGAFSLKSHHVRTNELTTTWMTEDDARNNEPAVDEWGRRSMLQRTGMMALGFFGGNSDVLFPTSSHAASLDATITDKIFLDIKGLPTAAATSDGGTTKRLVIGLFGKDAPRSTAMLKQLVSPSGLATECKPRAERTLQKEQLEANKVYNSCIDSQDKGVTYEYSTVWRVIPNERIDVGAVQGKYVARQYPNWYEEGRSSLQHDSPGVVSVRKGTDGGFGFTIYPGSGTTVADLDENHIVVGRVMEESMPLVEELNRVPVITSSKLNYMALTGGPTTKSAPSRACQYGGAMYCNENKPLIKLSVQNVGKLE